MGTIWIKLEYTGDDDEAMDLVDRVLSDGYLQDQIQEHASDDDIDVEVTLALADFQPGKLGHSFVKGQVTESAVSEFVRQLGKEWLRDYGSEAVPWVHRLLDAAPEGE
jgi:hypothetical protein